jgi:hypothetical protein
MSRSLATIQALVTRELEDISDAECRARLASLLVEPSFQELSWEYGALGATRLCCIVATAADGNLAVVYCEDGFAPTEPWGAVSLAEASMGSDAEWYGSLFDAAIGAGFCADPPGYEVP